MRLFESSDSLDRPLDVAVGTLRRRYGTRVIQRGGTGDPTGPYTGLKIAYERVPSLEELEEFVGPSSSGS